jgi:hypothetical protein
VANAGAGLSQGAVAGAAAATCQSSIVSYRRLASCWTGRPWRRTQASSSGELTPYCMALSLRDSRNSRVPAAAAAGPSGWDRTRLRGSTGIQRQASPVALTGAQVSFEVR